MSKLFYTFIFLFFLNAFNDVHSQASMLQGQQKNVKSLPRKKIKILAIDGGGIRGLIPALVLKNLEQRLKKKKLVECFNVMSGTSTGGIIILMLNIPDKHKRPKYEVAEIVKFYKSFGKEIFDRSIWQRLISLDGWIAAKYSSDKLKHILKDCFKEVRFSESISNVIIPSYDIENDRSQFFKSKKAQESIFNDFYFYDVGLATSAAPTYFQPAKIEDLTGRKYILIDGGISANNPASAALNHARNIYGKNCDYVVISLGTGSFYGAPQKIIDTNSIIEKGGIKQWMQSSELISVILYAGTDIVNYSLKRASNNGTDLMYFRLQAIIDNIYADIDNTSSENIEALEKYAYKIIDENEAILDKIVQILEE